MLFSIGVFVALSAISYLVMEYIWSADQGGDDE